MIKGCVDILIWHNHNNWWINVVFNYYVQNVILGLFLHNFIPWIVSEKRNNIIFFRYLLKSAVSDDPLVSTNHRLRALKCLFSIASSSELEDYTGRTAADLRTYLKNLIFISRMENLNLPFNLQAFQEYNKSSLVEGWDSVL